MPKKVVVFTGYNINPSKARDGDTNIRFVGDRNNMITLGTNKTEHFDKVIFDSHGYIENNKFNLLLFDKGDFITNLKLIQEKTGATDFTISACYSAFGLDEITKAINTGELTLKEGTTITAFCPPDQPSSSLLESKIVSALITNPDVDPLFLALNEGTFYRSIIISSENGKLEAKEDESHSNILYNPETYLNIRYRASEGEFVTENEAFIIQLLNLEKTITQFVCNKNIDMAKRWYEVAKTLDNTIAKSDLFSIVSKNLLDQNNEPNLIASALKNLCKVEPLETKVQLYFKYDLLDLILLKAAETSDVRLLQTMLKAGANPNVRDKNMLPSILQYAIKNEEMLEAVMLSEKVSYHTLRDILNIASNSKLYGGEKIVNKILDYLKNDEIEKLKRDQDQVLNPELKKLVNKYNNNSVFFITPLPTPGVSPRNSIIDDTFTDQEINVHT